MVTLGRMSTPPPLTGRAAAIAEIQLLTGALVRAVQLFGGNVMDLAADDPDAAEASALAEALLSMDMAGSCLANAAESLAIACHVCHTATDR